MTAYSRELGVPFYERIDAPATPEQKQLLKTLSSGQINMTELAGEPVRATLTTAPGNDAPFGGIKVIAESGWFAARPSGTEDVYKIYAESFRSEITCARSSSRPRLRSWAYSPRNTPLELLAGLTAQSL